MSSPEQRAEWKALADAATEGPWTAAEQSHGEWFSIQSPHLALCTAFEPADAAFIAAARTAVPALLEEVERLREALRQAEGERDDLDTGVGTLLGENVELEAEVRRLREGIEGLAVEWGNGPTVGYDRNEQVELDTEKQHARHLRALLGGDQ